MDVIANKNINRGEYFMGEALIYSLLYSCLFCLSFILLLVIRDFQTFPGKVWAFMGQIMQQSSTEEMLLFFSHSES